MKWPRYKIWSWGITLLFILTVTLYVFELRNLDNTVNSQELIQYSVLIGLILGVAFGLYFQKKINPKEAVATIRIWLASLLVPVLLSPLMGSLINRKMASEPVVLPVEFLEEKPILSSGFIIKNEPSVVPDGYHLFVFLNGKIERFTSRKKQYPSAKRGQTVDLTLEKGTFGYLYLER